MTYRVVWLDTDFHELVTIGENLTLNEARKLKQKYDRTIIEEES